MHRIADPDTLLNTLLAMPPVRALSLALHHYGDDRLALRAPLADNINDKGCAFGGSLGSLLTLAGWGLVSLKLGEAGLAAEVYVRDSSLRFRAPVFEDLIATAWLAPGYTWDAVIADYVQRGRARADIEAEVRNADGTLACGFTGVYVARRGD